MKTERATTRQRSAGRAVHVCPLERADQVPGCGGKAVQLARLMRLGLPVPSGLVVTDAAFQEFLDYNRLREPLRTLCQDLDAACPEAFRSTAQAIRARILSATIPDDVREAIHGQLTVVLTGTSLIVRSSALGEDGSLASFAGQLDSISDVDSEQALYQALLACWASYWSERALYYQRSRGVALKGMGVVIQEQVRARLSGVLFTRNPDPANGADSDLLVEYCRGPGEALVAGRINPGRVVLDREQLRCRGLALPEQPGADRLREDQAVELARAGLAVEEAFGRPQDIEWTIDHDERLFLVQSRPITTGSIAPTPRVVWSNANVNENFPDPISPLLYSIAADGYYHYFRNLGLAFGIARRRIAAMEYPLRQLIGVHGARMYYNLSHIHAVLRQAPFGDLLADFFNNFVGAGAAPRAGAAPPERGLGQLLEVAHMLLCGAWQFLFLSRRVARFERTVDRFAGNTKPATLAGSSLLALRDHLRAFLDIRFRRWTNASLADAAGMLSYGILKRLLEREFPGDDRAALHNTLLKGLPDLVSGEPIAHLWTLSRQIRQDPYLAQLFASRSNPEILAELRTRAEFAGFCAEFEAYLEQWGFRCSGELMLTVPSFQEEPARLLDVLRAYAALDGEAPLDVLRCQDAARVAATAEVHAALRQRRLLRLFPWPTRALPLRVLLTWTQRAIALRERARLKQALLYSRCRQIALAIGSQLVRRGRLEESAQIFFLTYSEIDALLSGSAMFPHQVLELVRLRAAGHAELGAVRPPDRFELAEGAYLPPGTTASAATHEGEKRSELSGSGVCGGRATGPATILHDVAECQRLARGDILVTRQTDPGWGPVFFLIKGLVMERGGMLSHGAILAREYGIPTVVGVPDATRRIAPGQIVAINGDRGLVQLVS